MRYDFKSESCFSGVLGYLGLADVGVLGSDNGVQFWFLLVRVLFLFLFCFFEAWFLYIAMAVLELTL
jgi:hypothetical protein